MQLIQKPFNLKKEMVHRVPPEKKSQKTPNNIIKHWRSLQRVKISDVVHMRVFSPQPNSETLCALSSFLCELPDIHIGITYISKFRFNIQFQTSLLNCFIFTLNTSLPDVPMQRMNMKLLSCLIYKLIIVITDISMYRFNTPIQDSLPKLYSH